MVNSQTIISIRRDKVNELRELNKRIPNFFKMFMNFHNISNFPLYLSDSIYVSHSEHSSITTCHVITPFLGSTLTHIFHKAYTVKDSTGEIEWHDRNKIIQDLIMGFKGVFSVDNIDKLEIESDFANAKNSVYSVFGLYNTEFNNLTEKDFDKILDITEFKYQKDKAREQALIESVPKHKYQYMGSFAQRQACLAFQSEGEFKAYPFKSNKNINFDLNELKDKFEAEARRLNRRLEFASKEEQSQILMRYVATHEFRDELSCRLFEAFISGLKGQAIKEVSAVVEKEKDVVNVDDDEDSDD